MLNAGRRYLGLKDLTGRVFLTSGLGGMSGAQAKAATICGCIGIVAEVSTSSIDRLGNHHDNRFHTNTPTHTHTHTHTHTYIYMRHFEGGGGGGGGERTIKKKASKICT